MLTPLILLLSFLIPSPSLAQISLFSSNDKDATIDRAEFGFSGTVPPEAWAPITVWISGGERGLSGALIVEYNQDDTQPARIIVPAAATPGVSVPIEAVACLPVGLDTVTLTLVDQNLRQKAKARYTRMPGRDERQLTADIVDDQGLILCVGRTSAARAFAPPRFISLPTDEDGNVVYSSGPEPPPDLVLAVSDPSRLPLTWAAYSGLEAVVLDADLSPPPDPRAIEAIRTWVVGGGRLILVARAPGNLWRRWFPPGPAGDLIELQEVARHQTPTDLGDAVHATSALPRANGSVYAIDAARRDVSLEPATFQTPAADTVAGRLIRPNASAAAQGWTTRWSPPGSSPAGLLAEGPVGLGWVTVLGLDPELAAATPTKETSAAAWGDAIRLALAGWLERTSPAHTSQNQNMYISWDYQRSRSAPDRDSRAAITGALNSISTVKPVGRAVFWGIAACLAILALLVGPVDAVLLKRLKMRQLSWLTALAWIGLASAGAYFVPGAIRTGKTSLNGIRAIDVLSPGDGASAPQAWQTGLTGIFASGRGDLKILDANPRSWWRGVSSRPWQPWERVRTTPFPALTTVQSATDGTRSNVPENIWQGQWTFRMFEDDGPVDSSLDARVTRVGDGYDVQVTGLAPGAVISSAALRIGDAWHSLLGAQYPQTGAPREKPIVFSSSGTSAAGHWDRPDSHRNQVVVFPDSHNSIFGLPGPRQRGAAIEARVRSGAYAAVYLSITGGPPSPALDPPADYTQQTLARILVPLPESAGQGTTP